MIEQRITVLAIVGQHKFYDTLTNFLGIIGYWAGDFLTFAFIDPRSEHWHVSRNLGVCDLRRTPVLPQRQLFAL
jgi:hypothetical protein